MPLRVPTLPSRVSRRPRFARLSRLEGILRRRASLSLPLLAETTAAEDIAGAMVAGEIGEAAVRTVAVRTPPAAITQDVPSRP